MAEHSLRSGARHLTLELGEVFDMGAPGRHQFVWQSPEGSVPFVVVVMQELEYLVYRLAHDDTHNAWGLFAYQPGSFYDLAEAMLKHADAAILALAPFLDDERGVFIEGSREATAGAMFAHRRSDYAAMMLAELLDVPAEELRSRSREERDVAIERVRDALRSR